MSYHVPQQTNGMSQIYCDPRFNSPFNRPNNSNCHYYEEIDNIETSFMYCEDMLPSNGSSNCSQAALLPSNKVTNGTIGLNPYRPITTIDPNGETLETMI
jgi:hypothetical protein